ncbi:hypothetical protein CAPTEDRAFT_185371 [Capitella teleta]|uniref:Uncharacterized protein n=1 Tax=Capitella teleta TaxID=283909 RepID=R7TAR9_CAPTE|nr:hypothetical protein CAPTEDRAFT_185371 [Capitella teleta]|eukprot:ELT90803.1 hypothetical protein CAPTEDRAFT_185371 [Capitella teleta]
MSKDPFAVRGHRAYSSMTSPPPMDRVTRQTSRPFDPQDVVIGIPQPYRTSFSAVTPPQRMSRHVVTHSPPATKTKSQDVLVKRVAMSTDSILDEAEESPRSNFQRLNVRYASTPSHIYSSNKKQQYRDACDSGLQSSCDDVFSDNASVSSDDRLVREFMGQEVKTPADPSIREEPQVKMMITKEYVHQTTVNYSDIIGDHIPESSLKSDQIVLDMLRLKGLLPNSQNKSCTLPVTAPSRDSNAKRSLSTSIGNFFKKMSPKTLRKSRRDMAKQSKEGKTLPAESQRLLKSIEKNSPANGEVYSSFKKRTQSPHSIEASAMKPQALKAVEFPDNLLSPDYHGNGPPKSLNVRQVAEMEKRVFKFPSVSVESIGQCSLDVQQPAASELNFSLFSILMYP